MKYFLLFIFFIYSTLLFADVFRFDLDKKSKTVEMVKLEKLNVSKNCYDASKLCLITINKFVEKIKKNTNIESSHQKTYGHPASIFCQKIEGNSVIVFDKENNQYDLCLINNTYYIDSWDLFNQYKK